MTVVRGKEGVAWGEWAQRWRPHSAVISEPWDITVSCGNPRKPWQILGNFQSPREGCRVGEENRAIRYNVMYTSWAICPLNFFFSLFRFSGTRVPFTHQAMGRVPCLPSHQLLLSAVRTMITPFHGGGN